MAIVIDVQLADSKGTSAAIERLEKAIARLEATVDKMNQGFKDAANLTNRIADNLSGAANAAQRMANATAKVGARVAQATAANAAKTMLAVMPPPVVSTPGGTTPPPIVDPYAAMDYHRAGAMAGDYASAKAYNRAKSMADALKRAKKHASGQGDDPKDRTRYFNFMGMEIPLPLGRDMAAFGRSAVGGGGLNLFALARIIAMAPKLSPVLLGVTGAAAGIFLLGKVAHEGSKRLQEFTNAMSAIGSSPGELSGALTAGNAVGMNAADIAQLSARIGSDSVARMIAARAGVPGLRGYFGDINDDKAFNKIVRYMSTLSYQQARRDAIGLGDTRLADFALMNKSLIARLTGPSALGSSMTDLRYGAQARGEQMLFNRTMDEYSKIMSGPAMRAAPIVLRELTRSMSIINNLASANFGGLNAALEVINGAYNRLQDWIESITGANNGRKEELKELQDINKGIQALNDGVYGGGARARKAQTGLMGPEVERAIQARAIGGGVGI